jgi:hypothetical protein
MNIYQFADQLELMGAQQRRGYRRGPAPMARRRAAAYGDIPNPAALPKCWNDEVGNELIAQCRQNHPQCNPQHVADVLSLEYCPGMAPCTAGSSPVHKAPDAKKAEESNLSYFALTFLLGGIAGAYLWSEVGHRRSRRV